MTEIPPESRDEQLLDEQFRRMVDVISAGESVDVARWLPERPDLQPQLAELFELAKTVAVTGAADLPRIEGYDLIREIGRGGMSVVYLAADLRLKRRVALKVMSGARVVGEHCRERFRREVGAIARLSHPNIVRVYEGGAAEGVPYFAMEHVEGSSLAEIVRGLRRLATPVAKLRGEDLGRLVLGPTVQELPADWRDSYVAAVCRLIAEVADALQHAHEHGVIHRDVKPSNVLVRRDGHALLFDFGLAHVADEASLTISGDFVGTPYYASPEQLDRKRRTSDARTDVYSLGVTLYELLTLGVPFPGGSTHEVLRQILTKEAPSPRRANPQISRDLETIVLEALEKDPGRRYASAADFAADLRRLLAFQPILARPSGSVSRTVKWVRRNRAGAAALVLGAVLAVGVPSGLLVQENLARRAVQRERDKVQAMYSFMTNLLGSVDPAKLGYEARIADSLTEAVKRLDSEFRSEPEIEIALRETIASLSYKLGLNALALPEYERVLAAVSAKEGPRSRKAIELTNQIGSCQCKLGKYPEARATISQVLATAETDFGALDPLTLSIRGERARIAQESGDPKTASEQLRELVQLYTRASGPDHVDTAGAKVRLAMNLGELSLPGESLKLLEEVLPVLERGLGPEHPDFLTTRNSYASALFRLGRYTDALPIFEDVLAKRRKLLGPGHSYTIQTLATIASVHHNLKQTDLALQEVEQAFAEARTAKFSENDRTVLDLYYKRGLFLNGKKEYAKAKLDLDHAAAEYTKIHGPLSENAFLARYGALRAIVGSKDYEEAARQYQALHETCKAQWKPEQSKRWVVQSGYADVLVKLGRYAEAELMLLEAEKMLKQQLSPTHNNILFVRRALYELYDKTQNAIEKAKYADAAPR